MYGPKPRPEADRFWPKVRKSDACWEWTGAADRFGYGRFRLGGAGRRIMSAHKWAWVDVNDPVPEGLELDHLCRNPSCVNPDHLEAVSHRVNILRSDAPPGVHARKTHCHRGHEFTPENTYTREGTEIRNCRECSRIRDRLRRPPGHKR